MSTMSVGDAILGLFIIIVCVVLAFVAVGREPPPKKPATRLFRFECTCGWVGWRGFRARRSSIPCPKCQGIAVQLNRGDAA